jgi:hypothetical protein
MRLFLIFFLTAFLPVTRGFGKEWEFDSWEKNRSLLELYTSEGCSSCPPAEEWLSKLTGSPLLWKELIPVAFHVDYWNYLGWPDPYSLAEASSRQHEYSREWRAPSVYTPEFVLNGREWRIGENIPPGKGRGVLKLRIMEDGTTAASYTPSDKSLGPFVVSVVPMACGIRQEVPRGENGGKTLRHDFVSLAVVQAPLIYAHDGSYTAQVSIPPGIVSKSAAIAAWVSSPGSPAPLQSVGGWLK